MSDIDTALVDRLKALDPNRPIREADIRLASLDLRRRGRYKACSTLSVYFTSSISLIRQLLSKNDGRGL